MGWGEDGLEGGQEEKPGRNSNLVHHNDTHTAA